MLFSNAGKLWCHWQWFDILNCHLALSRLKVSIIFVTNRYNGEVLLFTLYMTCLTCHMKLHLKSLTFVPIQYKCILSMQELQVTWQNLCCVAFQTFLLFLHFVVLYGTNVKVLSYMLYSTLLSFKLDSSPEVFTWMYFFINTMEQWVVICTVMTKICGEINRYIK